MHYKGCISIMTSVHCNFKGKMLKDDFLDKLLIPIFHLHFILQKSIHIHIPNVLDDDYCV